METPKEYYYTYYSYEEWGRGYIGSRGCKCLPEEDIKYLGSYVDKTFKPTQKIILKSDYATREEAYADEIILQEYYKVVENPHFTNQSYQTSTKFCLPKERMYEFIKKIAKKGGEKTKELGLGIHSLTSKEKSEAGRIGGKIIGKINGKKSKELKIGIHALTSDEKKEAGRLGGSQRWMCEETGFISNAAGIVRYQMKRGIDTSKRIRIE
jgi:hypothetical protein